MTTLENLSFEEALRELESIVRQLEEGKITLDQAIQAYEKGAALRTLCETKLKNARLRVDQIVVGDNHSISSKPIDSIG